jgi:membrane fusion protein, multidrug efflux system
MDKLKRKTVLLLFVTALSLALVACDQDEKEGANSPAGKPSQGKRPPAAEAAIPVKTEVVRRGDMVTYVQTHARLEAERQVDVLARATGLVETIAVEEGDRVREGDILVRLGKEELKLRLLQAQVALRQVNAAFERTKALHDSRMVSEAEFETVRHQVENARVALDEVKLSLDYADIRAPISGVVMLRLVEVGDLVRSNQQVLELADLEPLLARIHVPEKRMHQIRKGQEARVLIESLPDDQFTGEIRMISPGVDPQSGTIKVTLEIPDALDRLKPGMFASVRIITDRHLNTLIIPKKGLVIETDEDDVYVVADGKARRTRVELGFVEGDQVEVVQGLEEGDRVITVGQDGLKNGMAVRPVGLAPLAGLADGADSTVATDGRPEPAGARR